MFNPKLHTIPAAWRPIWLALGATLLAILASQTLTTISAFEPGSQTAGITAMQESRGFPEIAPVSGPSSSLLSTGQPPARSLVPLETMKRGDMRSEDARAASLDAGGEFPAERRQASGGGYGEPAGVFAVGRGGNETTHDPITRLTARQSRKALGGSPSTELAPLLNSDNLIRVFYFRNSSKDWLFYDPRPAFAAANTLVDLRDQEIYWLKVKRDQNVTLNGKEQRVSCTNEGTAQVRTGASEDCWNLLVW